MTITKEIEEALILAFKEENKAVLKELFNGLRSVGINISFNILAPDTGLNKVLTIENTANKKIYKAGFGWQLMKDGRM